MGSTLTDAPSDLLAAILAATERTVRTREARCPAEDLAQAAARSTPRGDRFEWAVSTGPRPRVVAECKRRSPARGVLRRDYDPAALARAYAAAGAAAVSVLTEPTFFDGALDHLRRVREATELPVLRKDFVVAAYQILEARAAGADAVLLIAAALPGPRLEALLTEARRQGLACLVEVHDERELARALEAGAPLIGVNSRNLRTLDVDLTVARRLIQAVPDDVVAVAESGLTRASEIAELEALGYDAFLIGESLMTAPDPGHRLRELRLAATDASNVAGGTEAPR